MSPLGPIQSRGLRSILASLFLLPAILVACGGEPRSRPGVQARHALLITVEGLRADHCSAHLYYRDTTTFPIPPEMRLAGRTLTLDELAHSGVLFAQAFAASGDPRASLAALHTGRGPLENGVLGEGDSLAVGETTLAECLAAAGFVTVAFVSAPPGGGPAGLDQGFERFHLGQGDLETLAPLANFFSERDWSNDRPLFLWLHLRQTTFPFEPFPLNDLEGRSIDYPTLFTRPDYQGGADGSVAFRERVLSGEGELELADRDQIVDLYDGEVALLNRLLYTILDYLRFTQTTSAGWQSTLTVVAGVNGVQLPDDGVWGKHDALRDCNLKVPLIVRHPDSLTGRRVLSEVVELSDVAPTLAMLFDVELPEPSGRSLLALTDSYVERDFLTRPAFAVAPDRSVFSLRTPEWRLLADAERLGGGEGALELYPVELMRERPDEASADHPRAVATLMGELRTWVGAFDRRE